MRDQSVGCPGEAAGNCNVNTFVHEGPLRAAKNCNGNCRNGNVNTFVHGGHGGPRRTATSTPLSMKDR